LISILGEGQVRTCSKADILIVVIDTGETKKLVECLTSPLLDVFEAL